ncbi:bet1-like protein [Tripterygium wilfordii]|uniref:Bet1-like protein n=1 Tax=Tripterygium wilfordii TaxID=458696 RepID=A0A7J7D1F4_TRIWF|nr:bet1-like protein [Tripterygium wilfordii]
MGTSSRAGGGSLYGSSAPYRSREGLSTRPVASSDEIQLRIDPMHADFDDEITGLRSQVKQLRNVAQEISTEAKFQRDFLDQLASIYRWIPEEDRVRGPRECGNHSLL